MNVIESPWTLQLEARLRELWETELSSAKIGQQLGISKNSVCGKVRRLGLTPRPSPLKTGQKKSTHRTIPRPRQGQSTVPALSAAPLASVVVETTKTQHQPLRPFARPTQCCWPIGTVGKPDFHFCEAVSVVGKPYCPQHCARAYTQVIPSFLRAAAKAP